MTHWTYIQAHSKQMKTAYKQRGVWFCLHLVFVLSACSSQQQYPFQYTGPVMGTSYTVKVSRLPEGVDGPQLQKKISTLLEQINGQMSTYLSDSELSRFNRNPSTDWQSVSRPLYNVLREAQQISRRSGGAFDITVGPLVNLWGFGPETMQAEPPAEASIAERLNLIGYKHLKLREQPLSVKKDFAGLYLDLSALAKGFAVDQVAELLEKQGISDYMVEIGGEIRLHGNNLSGKPWRIAVEKPTPDKRMIQRVLAISDIAMATSGDYRNFFEFNGVRFSHSIDPRTGRPISHRLASVTILRRTSMEADALATAMMVLGPEQGYRLAENERIAALFIIKDGDGFIEKSTTVYQQTIR